MKNDANTSASQNFRAAFGAGAIIGVLGGLIGLGGAEFRLPLLIGVFNFAALEAVILNKAMSLVERRLPFRAGTVPFSAIADHWTIVANLLAGSLLGAWFGAGWAIRLKSETLYKVIAGMLVSVGVVLVLGHDATAGHPLLTGAAQLDPHPGAIVWSGYQTRRKPLARCKPAYDARRLHALQPRSKLLGSRPQ